MIRALAYTLIALALIQSTPWFRRRAYERGIDHSLRWPLWFAGLGTFALIAFR